MPAPITGRRRFLGGLAAAGLLPKPGWADAGKPAFLAAAARPDGSYVLCGIDETLRLRFQIPLPARGHAAAAHPAQPEAVAFARRPGTFAIVIDCATARIKARLHSPQGRHFYGHGAFSADGQLLFTTENDFKAGRGRIGVWDTARGYTRIDEWDSGGIGPHDIKRLPHSETLVVANGGIDTHPDTGRTKLNIPTMQPNLTYIEDGQILDSVQLSPAMRKNSIRHLAVGPNGEVAFGMQWQGDRTAESLAGIHRRNAGIRLMAAPEATMRKMDNYVGSIAFSNDGQTIAATSPRGGLIQFYNAKTGQLADIYELEDASGVAPVAQGFALTAGIGAVLTISGASDRSNSFSDLAWDNHLISV